MKDNKDQTPLFDISPEWMDHWQGMPEYSQDDLTPIQSIKIHFADELDRKAFSKLVGQTVTSKTQSLWYPEAEIDRYVNKRWKSDKPINPRYPIYIPTKGRWESALTIKALEEMNIPYFAVIQPQELYQYKKIVKIGEILLLPKGLDGLVPARNWIKNHATDSGVDRHWQIDDNIDGFYRLQNNLKVQVTSGSTFRAMEDFSDRYENIAISGPNYFMFASRKSVFPPYTLNTRVYSCSLINNKIPHLYRDVYNDDTDICIRVLKDGWCTILFNAFLCYKLTTMTVTGGNTPIYQEDGRLKMAESLQKQHPDIVKITRKWDRWQHQVNYKVFKKNKLKLKPNIVIPNKVNNYGMTLYLIDEKDRVKVNTIELKQERVYAIKVPELVYAIKVSEQLFAIKNSKLDLI